MVSPPTEPTGPIVWVRNEGEYTGYEETWHLWIETDPEVKTMCGQTVFERPQIHPLGGWLPAFPCEKCQTFVRRWIGV